MCMRQIRLAVCAPPRNASLGIPCGAPLSVAAKMSTPGKRSFAPVCKAEPPAEAVPADLPSLADDGLLLEDHTVVIDWSDNKPALETVYVFLHGL